MYQSTFRYSSLMILYSNCICCWEIRGSAKSNEDTTKCFKHFAHAIVALPSRGCTHKCRYWRVTYMRSIAGDRSVDTFRTYLTTNASTTACGTSKWGRRKCVGGEWCWFFCWCGLSLRLAHVGALSFRDEMTTVDSDVGMQYWKFSRQLILALYNAQWRFGYHLRWRLALARTWN